MHSRTTRAVIAILVGAVGLSVTPAARSQYTNNFQDNFITGVASNWSGDYIVGSNTFADMLLVQNSGLLADGNGYLGYEASGSNNLAAVIGSGSVWSNSGNLYIGYSGADNFLWIAAGGAVVDIAGMLGGPTRPRGNKVLVSESGSVWSNSGPVYVGYYPGVAGGGDGNSLTISSGGAVYSDGAVLGGGSSTVVITGSGSLWANSGDLALGGLDIGDGGSLTVAEGGVLYDSGASLFHCTVLVSGSGSVWSNGSSALYSEGAMTIADGGAVYSSSCVLGGGFGAATVVVTGPGSVWNNAADLETGGDGNNTLTITNGGAVYSGDTSLGGPEGTEALVTGAGSVWSAGSFGVQRSGLTIADDGVVVASGMCGYIGQLINVAGGGLYVTNGPGIIELQGYYCCLSLNGGTVTANQLIVDNSESPNVSFEFAGGLFSSGGTFVTNGQDFAVGDGTNGAVFHLAGGFHSFVDGLLISNNGFLTGCGTIDGAVVVDPGGAVVADCGGTLSFTGTVTNNGSIFAVNGTFINFSGPVINNGSLVTTNGSVRFWAGINNYGSLVLDPNDDSDGDGIPNGWTQRYFGHPLGQASDLSRAGDDPDGDGMSNLQEYLAGTDPTDSASYLHITSITPQGDDLLVTWMMGAGRTNALQATACVADGGYSTNSFADIFIVTNTVGTVTNFLDIGGATNGPTRYYRVRLVP